MSSGIFTFPLNPPLAKGDLWQGVALLAYGDGGYYKYVAIIVLNIINIVVQHLLFSSILIAKNTKMLHGVTSA